MKASNLAVIAFWMADFILNGLTYISMYGFTEVVIKAVLTTAALIVIFLNTLSKRNLLIAIVVSIYINVGNALLSIDAWSNSYLSLSLWYMAKTGAEIAYLFFNLALFFVPRRVLSIK